MPYKALTHVNLPFVEKRFNPGDSIKKSELAEAQQTDEDIQKLIDNGAISEDMNAELHRDHRPVDANMPTIAGVIEQAKMIFEAQGDDTPAEIKRLAKLDYQHVVAGDIGKGDSNAG